MAETGESSAVQPVSLTPEQRTVLTASAVRLEIVDALEELEPCSIATLAHELGRKRSSLYYHVELMQKAGLVREAGRQKAGKRGEALYAMAVPWMRFTGSDRVEMKKSLIRLCRTVHRIGESRYRRAIESGAVRRVGDYENAFLRLQRGRLDATALAEVHVHLGKIAQLLERGRREKKGDAYTVLVSYAPVGT